MTLEETMRKKLPDGWAESDLRSILTTLETGSRPRGEVNGITAVIPKLGTEHLNSEGGLDLSTIRYIPEASVASMRRGQVEIGDILIVKDGTTTGRVSLVRSDFPFQRAALNEHVFRCRISHGIDASFIFWYLWSQQGQERLREHVQGSAQGGISYSFANKTRVPVAPTKEQRRIVAKIESVMERINDVRKRLKNVLSKLDRFRQLVLFAACSGHLTTDWREKTTGVEPAKVLFRRIQIDRRATYKTVCELAKASGRRRPKDPNKNKRATRKIGVLPDIPQSWRYYRLEQLSDLVTEGTHYAPQYLQDGVRFLSAKDIRPFSILENDCKYIHHKDHSAINFGCDVKRGDILYSKVGTMFGFAAQFRFSHPCSILCSLALIKPCAPYFCSDYAEIVMNSPCVFDQARSRVSGVGVQDLNLIEIRDFRIALPPLAEQHVIVRQVKGMFDIAHQIEKRVATVDRQIVQIGQIVLAKAFAGQLVETDASFAAREARVYEPASALLEQIVQDIGD